MVAPPPPPPSSAGPSASVSTMVPTYSGSSCGQQHLPAIYGMFSAVREVWFAGQTRPDDGREVWISGSGSTMHMTADGKRMYDYAPAPCIK